jgi:hypothetical protein
MDDKVGVVGYSVVCCLVLLCATYPAAWCCQDCSGHTKVLDRLRCDSHGYYFDRGGKRIFETSYGRYERGTFNARRASVWRGCVRRSNSCIKRSQKEQGNVAHRTVRGGADVVLHEHYTGQQGGTRWPKATDQRSVRTGTRSFPYVATPIWLRDTVGAGGYSTPTSWQGFQ